MDDSYNVIRRFTPPTCTLEIWGKNSPLSRWSKKTVVKDIQFKLSFDDPKNLDAEPIMIEGDRDKLEQLYTTVLDYTGNFLERSFNPKSLSLVTNNARLDDRDRPYVTSQGLVNYQLNLGSLSRENASIIALSATQLFDLVSALEEYKTEMAAIAKSEATQSKKNHRWIPIGASVAGILLAVGVVTGIKTSERSQKEIVVTQESPTNPITPQAEVVPPEAPEVAEQPTVAIEENDPLSSTEMLPPPPAVDTPKPPPNIPDPAKYPPSGNLTIPPVTELPEQDEVTLNPTESTTEAQPPLDDSQVESTINVPSETENTENTENTELEIASESNTQESIASPTEDNQTESLENIEEAEIAISDEDTELNTDITKRFDRVPTFDEEIRSSETTENNVEKFELSDRNIALDNTTLKPTTDESTITEDEPESKISQIVQLQEVTSYFKQKWQIPGDLKQTLEYRLILNRDGSIQRIIPIGKASEIYVDRTNIPLMGEPFVSPLQNRDSATIRLLLSPDGEVKTFLE
jgi:hypothetical protein